MELISKDFLSRWLNLFYDLALVAVLTIFSSLHEISDPIAAARFFSFFVLMVSPLSQFLMPLV